jgi:hypothetical protein
MPDTPCSRTSSAILKAPSTLVLSFDTVSSRSLGMTISVSTLSLSFWIPCSACTERRRPSNEKGRVTTPIVRAPRPLAISAMTGAAPAGAAALARGDEHHVGALHDLLDLLPVRLGRCPPDLRVAARAEAPRRLPTDVELQVGVAHQQCLRVGVHGDELDPLSPASIIRLTALTPPPPTPMTLITAR